MAVNYSKMVMAVKNSIWHNFKGFVFFWEFLFMRNWLIEWSWRSLPATSALLKKIMVFKGTAAWPDNHFPHCIQIVPIQKNSSLFIHGELTYIPHHNYRRYQFLSMASSSGVLYSPKDVRRWIIRIILSIQIHFQAGILSSQCTRCVPSNSVRLFR